MQSLAEYFRKPTPEEERLLRGEALDMSLYQPAPAAAVDPHFVGAPFSRAVPAQKPPLTVEVGERSKARKGSTRSLIARTFPYLI